MKNNLKIALAQLNPIVGDVKGNIIKLIDIRNNIISTSFFRLFLISTL